MNSYCTLCGRNHPDVTGGCMMPAQIHFPATTIHFPARTVSATDVVPTEICPTCNGSGRISAAIGETLKRIGQFLSSRNT